MTLPKFIIVALLVFLVGLVVLYNGLNHAPFRHDGSGRQHQYMDSRVQGDETSE